MIRDNIRQTEIHQTDTRKVIRMVSVSESKLKDGCLSETTITTFCHSPKDTPSDGYFSDYLAYQIKVFLRLSLFVDTVWPQT